MFGKHRLTNIYNTLNITINVVKGEDFGDNYILMKKGVL